MEDFEKYEYVIKPKKTKKDSIKKAILIIFYIAYVIAWLIFGFKTALIPLLALVPVTLWIIIYFTWRYVKVEYEYHAESGIVTITKIYDSKSRKEILDFDIRSAELIAPMKSENTEKAIENFDPKHEYYFITEKHDENSFAILTVNEDSERIVIFVTASEKLKNSFKFYNHKAFLQNN